MPDILKPWPYCKIISTELWPLENDWFDGYGRTLLVYGNIFQYGKFAKHGITVKYHKMRCIRY